MIFTMEFADTEANSRGKNKDQRKKNKNKNNDLFKQQQTTYTEKYF